VNRRVVVTGIGLVSSLGVGTEPTWAGICQGRSGVVRITKFDVSAFACQIVPEVPTDRYDVQVDRIATEEGIIIPEDERLLPA
jgi:3-oxoacyl-[acyl-carrier-protein] synthase II